MRYAASWIPSALFVLGATTSSFAAPNDGAAAQDIAVTTAKVPISIFGQKLTGVDGSTIEMVTTKDSFWREMATADGALQKLNFAYLNDALGTVTNARDASRVTAVFRATKQEIFIYYTDGSTERLTPNSGGGLSIETRSPGGTVSCKSFYDEGHVFGIDERKAALAQFANRLGIMDSVDKPAAQSACPAIAELSLLPVPPMTTTLKAGETAEPLLMDMAMPHPGIVPAISSPVGANTSVLTADCGIFADTEGEWRSALTRLLENEDLRKRYGRSGRERAVAHYSLEAHAPRLISLFKELAEQRIRVPSTRR